MLWVHSESQMGSSSVPSETTLTRKEPKYEASLSSRQCNGLTFVYRSFHSILTVSLAVETVTFMLHQTF